MVFVRRKKVDPYEYYQLMESRWPGGKLIVPNIWNHLYVHSFR